jgi:HEAT repeat protein
MTGGPTEGTIAHILEGVHAAVKRKLSIQVVLATVSGALALAPIRATAQQFLAPESAPAVVPSTAPTAYDAVAVLTSPTAQVSQSQRDEAAQRLLSRHTNEARQSLRDALISQNELAQLAVARALAMNPDADTSFIDPLFRLLDVAKIAPAAGRALAGYKTDGDVLARLIDRASGRTTPRATREAAIHAIGAFPEKRAAAVLVQMLESPDELPAIHSAAAQALTSLTGLAENGEDPTRWKKWWDSVRSTSDSQFRTQVNATQAATMDRLNARYDGLVASVQSLLRDEYEHKTKSPAERQELMLALLHSPEPEVRKIGTTLLAEDVEAGNPISPEELTQLRDLIADSDPSVRRAVADTIKNINDPDALDALLNQLAVEPDPTVRAKIAAALGPIHDLRAVPTLVKLLSDDSLDTAKAAAESLGDLAQDKLPTDPVLSQQAADALKNAAIAREGTPGSDDFRAACINALAPLKNSQVVAELLDHKLDNSGKEESPGVRSAMIAAMGELNDPKLNARIVVALNDYSPAVQKQAIDALKESREAASEAGPVGDLVKFDPARGQEVSDEAWIFMQSIFPSLNERQLSDWVNKLQGDPSRQLIALQALKQKQQNPSQQSELAVTDTQIGGAYMALQQWGDAAANYRAALVIYDQLPNINSYRAEVETMVARYMQSLLNDDQYAQAVDLAKQRITRDPDEQHDMGELIYTKAQQLVDSGKGKPDDIAKAKQLIDLATKMVPKLDDKHQDLLNALAQQIKTGSSSFDNWGPLQPAMAIMR